MKFFFSGCTESTIFSSIQDFRRSSAYGKYLTASDGLGFQSFEDWFCKRKKLRVYSSIGRNEIKQLFILYFNLHAREIAEEYSELPITVVSIDQTFKAVKKIRMKINGRFKQIFYCLTLAMSETNCVKSLTFTKSKKISDMTGRVNKCTMLLQCCIRKHVSKA